MISIFACGLRPHRKTHPTISSSSLLVSLSFSTNNVCKNTFFFLVASFPNKAFVFPTIESAKHAFAARAGSGKPALLHVLFLENEKQNSRKKYGAMFSREVQGHMRKFNSFRG